MRRITVLALVVLFHAHTALGASPEVQVLARPSQASVGNCIGAVDTVECAAQTVFACWVLGAPDLCRQIAVDRYVGPPYERPVDDGTRWYFAVTDTKRLDAKGAKEVWIGPYTRVYEGNAYVRMAYAVCPTSAVTAGCTRHTFSMVVWHDAHQRRWRLVAYQNDKEAVCKRSYGDCDTDYSFGRLDTESVRADAEVPLINGTPVVPLVPIDFAPVDPKPWINDESWPVLVMLEPRLASQGHCIGDISTPVCAAQTVHACEVFEVEQWCARVGFDEPRNKHDDAARANDDEIRVALVTRWGLVNEADAAAIWVRGGARPGDAFVTTLFGDCGTRDRPERCATGSWGLLLRRGPQGWTFVAFESEDYNVCYHAPESWACAHNMQLSWSIDYSFESREVQTPDSLDGIPVNTRDLVPIEADPNKEDHHGRRS